MSKVHCYAALGDALPEQFLMLHHAGVEAARRRKHHAAVLEAHVAVLVAADAVGRRSIGWRQHLAGVVDSLRALEPPGADDALVDRVPYLDRRALLLRASGDMRLLERKASASRVSFNGDNMCLDLAVHSTPPEPPGDRFRCFAEPRGITGLDLIP